MRVGLLIPIAAVFALQAGCVAIDYTFCGAEYCADGEVCTPDQSRCAFPEQIESCDGKTDGTFCTYSGVPTGACMTGVCLSQTTTTLATPEEFTASDGSSTEHVELSWSEVSGATGYRVWRDSVAIMDVTTTSYQDTGATGGGVPTMPTAFAATQGTSLADVGLGWTASTTSSGTTHTYFVTALAFAAQSAPSQNDTGYRGAYAITSYQLSVDGGTSFTGIGVVTGYTDTTAPIGSWTATVTASDTTAGKVALAVSNVAESYVQRSYAVRAVNGAGTSAVATTTGFRDVGSPTGYQWQWSDASNGTYASLAGATTTSYDDTTGPVVTPRFYRCLLTGANGATATVGPDSGTRGLEAPANVSASDGTASAHVALTWDAVYGATGYRVFRGGSVIADVSTNSHNDTAAASGGAPTQPGTFAATAGTNLTQVTLTWASSTSTAGASQTYTVAALANTTQGPISSSDTGYRAAYPVTRYEVSLDAGATYSDVGNVTTYADTTAPVGSWTATVTASDGTAGKVSLSVTSITESFASRSYRARAVSGAGTSTSASATGYRDVGNVTGYQWQWSDTTNGTYTNLAGATTATYDDTTGPVITPRYYGCVLTGQNGATATVGPDAGTRGLEPPTGVAASDGTSSAHVTVTWNTVYGATGYRVFRGSTAIGDVTAASHDDTGASAGGVPSTPTSFAASDGTYTDRVQLTWTGSTSSNGSSQGYTVAAMAGTTVGPSSTSDTGYRGAYPITYELSIASGAYSNIGAVTTYSDTTAPEGSYSATATASDGKAGMISLSANAVGVNGTSISYTLRATNTAGTSGTTTNTGYRGVGTASYQWQRSASTTDGSYSNIASATAATYDDTTSFPTFEARWYRVVVSAAGTSGVTSAGDPGWRGLKTTPTELWAAGGQNTDVRTTVLGNGVLYIGGNFSYVGPKTGSFTKVGLSGTGTVDTTWPTFVGATYAAASDGRGGWYVAGAITSVNGAAVQRVVHVTSSGALDTQFSPPVISGNVLDIVLSGGVVYIGGSFTSVGGQARNYLAALDATTGALSTTWIAGTSGQVNALAVVGTKLYAGGEFASAGGSTRSRLAAFDLTTGALDGWNPTADDFVSEMGVIGTTIYIEGNFHVVGALTRNYLAAIDATTGAVTSWDPNPSSWVSPMYVSGGYVYVAGNYSTIGGMSRSGLTALDGTTGVPTSLNVPCSNVYAFAVVGNTLYAGTAFLYAGGVARYKLAAVDLTSGAYVTWNPQVSDAPSLLVTDGTSLFMGGSLTSAGGVTRHMLAAIDLTTGQPTSWNPDVSGGISPAVETIAVSGDNVYVGGNFTTVSTQTRNRLAAVSASTGSLLTWNPNASATVRSLVVSSGTVYAGGDFVTVGGQSRSRIAALDGAGAATSWNPTADGNVFSLAVDGSNVYAGGDFAIIGGQARSRIAAIDKTTALAVTGWDPNANETVRTIVLNGTTVFLGGEFTTVGGLSRARLAQLDATTGIPTSWVGSGFSSGGVDSIALNGSGVFYCGSGGVAVRDLTSATLSTTFALSYGGTNCSLTFDGSRLWVGGNLADRISAFDP